MNEKNQDNEDKGKDATLPVKLDAKPSVVRNALTTFFPTEVARIERPKLGREFCSLPMLERVSGAVKYNILSLEYSISPNGGLRQWIKVNVALLLLVGIPAVVITILALLITTGLASVMGHVVEIAQGLADSTSSLLEALVNIVKIMLFFIAIGTVIYFANIAYRKNGKSGGKNNYKRDYIDVTPRKRKK